MIKGQEGIVRHISSICPTGLFFAFPVIYTPTRLHAKNTLASSIYPEFDIKCDESYKRTRFELKEFPYVSV